jgi:hypothetical protein
MSSARNYATGTLLNGGLVLVTGGNNGTGPIATAELYNPATGTFTPTGSMASPRFIHSATLLNNGMVLVAGGSTGGNSTAAAELYNPATGAFTPGGSLSAARVHDTATLLITGAVLFAGGYDAGFNTLGSAELYQPPSLTPAGLISINVTPANPSVTAGAAQQFLATGTFSDNSTQVLASATWSSSNPSVAPISNDAGNHGIAAAVNAGTTVVTARVGAFSTSQTLTVNAPVLVSISVTPASRRSRRRVTPRRSPRDRSRFRQLSAASLGRPA